MKKIGLIINPYAGIGGKVALKGSDGEHTVKEALARGGKPESGDKVLAALAKMEQKDGYELLVPPGIMGESVVEKLDLPYRTLRIHMNDTDSILETSKNDTMAYAKEMLKEDVDILMFAGGDGTARDIMDAVGKDVTVLGLPTGCKIHSGVYAKTPTLGVRVLEKYLSSKNKLDSKSFPTKEAEVMDIDEIAFRKGNLRARLYGYMDVLSDCRMQNKKSGSVMTQDGDQIKNLGTYAADSLKNDVLYIVGSGSTTKELKNQFDEGGTLLGVDLIYNQEMIQKDCTEQDILNALDCYEKAKIIVTVIGGQGYLFGRGNQQLSAEVIRRVGKENIIVIATRNKIQEFFGKSLYVDTGSDEIDDLLQGYVRVLTGYQDYAMMRVGK